MILWGILCQFFSNTEFHPLYSLENDTTYGNGVRPKGEACNSLFHSSLTDKENPVGSDCEISKDESILGDTLQLGTRNDGWIKAKPSPVDKAVVSKQTAIIPLLCWKTEFLTIAQLLNRFQVLLKLPGSTDLALLASFWSPHHGGCFLQSHWSLVSQSS